MVSIDAPDTDYAALATQIARIVWGHCLDEIDGRLCYLHYHENDLDVPCDMLARLGVMQGYNGVGHSFTAESPLEDLILKRHTGEPTREELISALLFLAHWHCNEAKGGRVNSPDPAATDFGDRTEYLNSNWTRFRHWSIQGACDLLATLGKSFNPNDRYSGRQHLRAYWDNRAAKARQLGGEAMLFPSS